MCFRNKKKVNANRESVAVYFDANDGSFYFEVVSESEFKQFKVGKTQSAEAMFGLSQTPFDNAKGIAWEYDNPQVLYITDVVLNHSATDVILDVLHDFMVMNVMEREAETMRLELPADSPLAASLSKEDDYRIAGQADGYVYFEVDISAFE